jgi:hypothetical protein
LQRNGGDGCSQTAQAQSSLMSCTSARILQARQTLEICSHHTRKNCSHLVSMNALTSLVCINLLQYISCCALVCMLTAHDLSLLVCTSRSSSLADA